MRSYVPIQGFQAGNPLLNSPTGASITRGRALTRRAEPDRAPAARGQIQLELRAGVDVVPGDGHVLRSRRRVRGVGVDLGRKLAGAQKRERQIELPGIPVCDG